MRDRLVEFDGAAEMLHSKAVDAEIQIAATKVVVRFTYPSILQ